MNFIRFSSEEITAMREPMRKISNISTKWNGYVFGPSVFFTPQGGIRLKIDCFFPKEIGEKELCVAVTCCVSFGKLHLGVFEHFTGFTIDLRPQGQSDMTLQEMTDTFGDEITLDVSIVDIHV